MAPKSNRKKKNPDRGEADLYRQVTRVFEGMREQAQNNPRLAFFLDLVDEEINYEEHSVNGQTLLCNG